MGTHDGMHLLINQHSWYHFDTALDQFRAFLWCASNFATALAYFLIPREIRQWRKALSFSASSLIGNLFFWFIALCGFSHFAMLAIMQTGPWWAVLLIYLPMAVVSLATVWVIRAQRGLILLALNRIGNALREP